MSTSTRMARERLDLFDIWNANPVTLYYVRECHLVGSVSFFKNHTKIQPICFQSDFRAGAEFRKFGKKAKHRVTNGSVEFRSFVDLNLVWCVRFGCQTCVISLISHTFDMTFWHSVSVNNSILCQMHSQASPPESNTVKIASFTATKPFPTYQHIRRTNKQANESTGGAESVWCLCLHRVDDEIKTTRLCEFVTPFEVFDTALWQRPFGPFALQPPRQYTRFSDCFFFFFSILISLF